MKKFHPSDLVCLENLIGKSISDIFYQPVSGILAYVDMFVVNFGDKREVSLHVFSFFRVVNSNILLTASDCFFDSNYERLTPEEEENERSNLYEKTLLHSNIEHVKDKLKNAKVLKAYATDIGDVIIEFDNDIKMEIIIDALCNQECYRLITNNGKSSHHNVVTCNKGQLFYYTE